ncbi:galactokinase [Adhaeretor mobilis]|uniref:Galactokinase n=1 Tax=Adhaeretor mobilis TaxID=1930276 RepID=A0A517MYR9_9BACT|nr:galactokinase [Adhaeretor mobilis]QDT00017.1 Galactokinase [Adhaeretor mobilis]
MTQQSITGAPAEEEFETPSFGEQIATVRADYERTFDVPPEWIVAAPGRVNLIGEHTDYNAGFVFPLAIERYVVIAGGRPKQQGSKLVKVHSTLLNETVDFSLDDLKPEEVTWTSYIRGAFAGCLERGMEPGGLNLAVDSKVPLGGGLSSSAALEVATATMIEAVTGKKLDPVDKARLCQKAEHDYAGVPCGIMDQFSSSLGEAGKLLLIDCRTETAEMVSLDDLNVAVLIINTNVKHELTGGEYAERRSQCEAAAKELGVKALRDITLEKLEAYADKLEPVLFRRARHVVSENERVLKAAEALRAGDWEDVGELMYASHNSLRDDYKVSCPELDVLVNEAHRVGTEGGVIGSRMTGGGFGGCTVTLVAAGKEREIADKICQGYQKETGIEATPFVTKPARGAHIVQG